MVLVRSDERHRTTQFGGSFFGGRSRVAAEVETVEEDADAARDAIAAEDDGVDGGLPGDAGSGALAGDLTGLGDEGRGLGAGVGDVLGSMIIDALE